MRISKLSFSNLNSLSGSWEIDFTEPAYEGIFAITGPTGSGKSTILDAICLALYARTPRLDKCNATENEIMSVNTGYCQASVRFKTDQGEFKAEWYQHKAKKKPDGELQQYRHQVFKIIDNDKKIIPLTQKPSEAKKKVEEITGLDYERFTQSVLLAQGKFAEFLLANSKERAPLLEQITKTTVYTQISKSIFEHHRDLEKELDGLKDNIAGAQAATPEEIHGWEDRLLQIGRELDVYEKKTAEYDHLIHEAKELKTRRSDLKAKEQELCTAREESLALDVSRDRLKKDAQAMPLREKWALLERSRDDLTRNKKELDANEKALPDLERKGADAESSLNAQRVSVGEREERWAQLNELLKSVRELDTQIRQYDLDLRAEESAVETLKSNVTSLSEQHTGLLEESRNASEALKKIQEEKAASQVDENLVGDLPGMEIHFRHLQAKSEELRSIDEQIRMHEQTFKEMERNTDEAEASFQALSKAEEETLQARQKMHERREALLQGRTLDDMMQKIATLEKVREQVTARQKSVQWFSTRSSDLAKGRRDAGALSKRITHLESALQSKENELEELKKEHRTQTEWFHFSEMLKNYDAARERLIEGQPCPLCGALMHPYAKGLPPNPIFRTTLESLNAKIGRTEKEKSELEKQKARSETMLDNLREEIIPDLEKAFKTERDAFLDELGILGAKLTDMGEGVPAASMEAFIPSLSKELQELLEGRSEELPCLAKVSAYLEHTDDAVQTVLEQANASMKEAKALARQEDALQKDVEKNRTQLDTAQKRRAELRLEKERHRSDKDRCRTQFSEGQNVLKGLFETLNGMFHRYGFAIHDVQEARFAIDALKGRKKRYDDILEQEGNLREQRSVLEKELASRKASLDSEHTSLQEKEKRLNDKHAHLRHLRNDRETLFGKKDADAEETREKVLLDKERRVERGLSDAYNELLNQIRTQRKLIETSRRSVTQNEAELACQEGIWSELLVERGWTEAAFLSASLSDEERKTMNERIRSVDDKMVELQSAIDSLDQQISQYPRFPEEQDEMERRLAEWKHQINTLMEERGAIQQKLKDNQEKEKTLGETRALLEAKKPEVERWANLNKLIGSGDGQKYRNFVQGLTFRHLLVHANRQLSLLTDRYVLIPAKDSPLSLDVMDHYQGDSIRSSRNLSGGESFIVSLSLALGLAKIAGGDIKVASIFLDEGFGTLDEKALESALEMLVRLRQTGKNIGLISHVRAIQEQIGARIVVEPQGGGISRISGHGVKRLKDTDQKSKPYMGSL